MEKLSVCFFIEDKAVLLSLEEILPNLHNGRIGRQLLNTSREINFPVFEKNNKYFIDNSRNILMQFSNENQQRFISLQHGELFSTIEQGESYQFLILSHSYLSVKMKKVILPVNGTITLGRSEQSNIVIDLNDNISRCHARIHIISNEASIEDTSGKAGIYVNGKKVIAANLKCGDTVMIMGYTILYMKRFLMIPETVFAINGLNTFSRFEEVKKSERNTMVEFERNPRIYTAISYVAIGEQTSMLEQKNATQIQFSSDGKELFYVEDLADDEESGDLYKANISEKGVQKPEFVDEDVYPYLLRQVDNHLIYFKNYDSNNNRGDLWVDGKKVDSDVCGYKLYFNEGAIFYYSDWNEDKRNGTLKLYKKDKTTKIADDVYSCMLKEDSILYLHDFSWNSYTGSLFRYENGNSEKISDDVNCIIF